MRETTTEKRIKQKKSFVEWIKEDIRNDLRMWRGGLSGAVAGYLVSFFFQPELIRAKLGFFGYVSHFFDILFSFGDRMSAQIAVTAWISVVIGAVIGRLAEKRLIEKGKIKPWTRKNTDGQDGRQP